ncbi:FAD-dependent oxidoreductase [Nitriliruptor alkaliphilus]|uniref:FAD-dependent oxidoreductase n=1 Tax=Nitriliruptor alkaliphilus TaxID=427918 RepID=UPI000695C185|nr:FAD-dependent oxidoreductase [Nitriliruptor alkaliphilus]
MTAVLIVGDGPGGLSAALFLAKAGHTVTVFGQDRTAMHHAHVFNYLGVPDVLGSDFQQIARRHASDHGATIVDAGVTGIELGNGTFTVEVEDHEPGTGEYLVLAGGKPLQPLARSLGLPVEDGRVEVDSEYRTSIDRVYAIGRLVRPERSQAIISAGAGGIAALDILSREAGEDVHDWDTPA